MSHICHLCLSCLHRALQILSEHSTCVKVFLVACSTAFSHSYKYRWFVCQYWRKIWILAKYNLIWIVSIHILYIEFFAIDAQSRAVSKLHWLLCFTWSIISLKVWLCHSKRLLLPGLWSAVVFTSTVKFSDMSLKASLLNYPPLSLKEQESRNKWNASQSHWICYVQIPHIWLQLIQV